MQASVNFLVGGCVNTVILPQSNVPRLGFRVAVDATGK